MAVSAGYAASQNKRWQEANKSNDTDLMNRLQADSKRAGYTLDPYQSAVQNVQKSVSQPASAPSAPAASTTTPVTTPTSRTNQTLNSINDLSNQGFQFTKPDEFKYDQNTDPAYQAAIASAQQNITQNRADTNAALRAGGQGKSSFSEGVANQIGAKEMARVSTDVLPALISQAYQRYADDANRSLAIQQANYGVTQDRIANLANLYGMQNNEDFTNPMTEAQLTGQYLSGEARQYINAINNLKAQAETPGITADQRTELSSQADAYRAALQGLGIDSTLFGANVNQATSQGNMNRAGITTLDAQQQQYAQSADQRNFDEGVRQYDQNFGYQQERDTVADNQWLQQFNEHVRQFGLNNALDWAAQSVSQQNANTNSGQLALSRDRFNYDKTQDTVRASSGAGSSSSSSSATGKISAKDSTNATVDFRNYIIDRQRQDMTKAQAVDYLAGMAGFFTDSDYKAMLKFIESQYSTE